MEEKGRKLEESDGGESGRGEPDGTCVTETVMKEKRPFHMFYNEHPDGIPIKVQSQHLVVFLPCIDPRVFSFSNKNNNFTQMWFLSRKRLTFLHK